MTLRFVKTSVLTSEDGLDFSKEEALETEEARQARLARENASNKPLYQQLAEQQAKKQEEYDANTKLMFAPPKGLDMEEYNFLESINETRERTERQRKEEETKALEEFRAARKVESSDTVATTKSSAGVGPTLVVKTSTKPASSTQIPLIKAVKRKIVTSGEESSNLVKKVKAIEAVSSEVKGSDSVPVEVVTTATGPSSSLDLLCGYGSDSDDA